MMDCTLAFMLMSKAMSFRRLLGDHGIVELGDDETYSVGRKWRSALNKLGFLYPEVPVSVGIVGAERNVTICTD